MSFTVMLTPVTSPLLASASAASKLDTPVSALQSPRKVAPPSAVPVMREYCVGESTRRTETPEPMFTRMKGNNPPGSGASGTRRVGRLSSSSSRNSGGGSLSDASSTQNASSSTCVSRNVMPRTSEVISSTLCSATPSELWISSA
eukprot:Amastigsp_a3757_4.p3 type:complete len:145 gc:universal Amastigsp_a3757_4:930-496(-)